MEITARSKQQLKGLLGFCLISPCYVQHFITHQYIKTRFLANFCLACPFKSQADI